MTLGGVSPVPREARPFQGEAAGVVTRLIANIIDGVVVAVVLSGGIVTIAPGKGEMATFSPPLDGVGNRVRGQLATKLLAEGLGLDILASKREAESRDSGA